jgi:hypothetical protein
MVVTVRPIIGFRVTDALAIGRELVVIAAKRLIGNRYK